MGGTQNADPTIWLRMLQIWQFLVDQHSIATSVSPQSSRYNLKNLICISVALILKKAIKAVKKFTE